MHKFRTKNASFWYFSFKNFKNYSHILNQHTQICVVVKVCEKMKMPKFGTKNALFDDIWVRILKNYCHI